MILSGDCGHASHYDCGSVYMMRDRSPEAWCGQGRGQRGFSLVEAAIVLVVIGVILGAVLQGRSLIESAEYNSFCQQLREYQGAFHNFRDRYNASPGDFEDASARIGAPDPGGGDGGNGVIDDGPGCASDDDESCLAWQHLRSAGMLGGNPEDSGEGASPAHPFGGQVASFFTGDLGNGAFGHKMLVTGVPVEIAVRLDRDEDNELCGSGRVSLREVTGASCANGDEDWPADPDGGTVDIVYAL